MNMKSVILAVLAVIVASIPAAAGDFRTIDKRSVVGKEAMERQKEGTDKAREATREIREKIAKVIVEGKGSVKVLGK